MVHIKFSNKFHYFRRIWPYFSIDHTNMPVQDNPTTCKWFNSVCSLVVLQVLFASPDPLISCVLHTRIHNSNVNQISRYLISKQP